MLRAQQATRREAEIRTIHRILLHRPFRELLRRQRIDLTEHAWRAFDDMILRALHRCATCPRRDACRQWLKEVHPGENHPAFCPNGLVVEACRIIDPHAAPTDASEVEGRCEPAIADVIADPIVAQLMDADDVPAGTWQSWMNSKPAG